MEILSFDFGVTLFFLFSMVAVLSFKKQLRTENNDGYKNISSGLIILLIISLSKIYSNLGLFHTLPFLAEPLFYKLIYWIGVLTGITFLITGVTTWLPLSRSYRKYNQIKIKRLEFIKKIEQYVRIESRLHIILEKTLEYMLEYYGLLKGAVYISSPKRNKMVFIAAAVSSSQKNIPNGNLEKIKFKKELFSDILNNTAQNYLNLIENMPSALAKPGMIIPIVIGNIIVGVFVLWNKSQVILNDDDRMNLKIGVDIVANKIKGDRLLVKNRFYAEQRYWQKTLFPSLNYSKNIKDNINIVINKLKEKVRVDLSVLSIVHDDDNVQRYIIGRNNSLLNEVSVDFYKTPTITNYIYNSSQPVKINDLVKNSAITVDEIVLKSNMKSLIAFPVICGKKVEGVVLFASTELNGFDEKETSYIETVLPVITHLVKEEKYLYYKKNRERRSSLLNGYLSDICSCDNLQEIYSLTSALISKELNPTMVRISTYDNEGAFLDSQAMDLIRPLDNITPSRGSMILSLMPLHLQVKDTGKTMLIKASSTEYNISDMERKQMFGFKFKSALLVPVKLNNSIPVVISIAEMRSWRRYKFLQNDIEFVNSIASLLSVGINLQLKGKTTKSHISDSTNELSTPQIDAERKSRIKSSLTGIIGSVELLKSTKQPNKDSLKKCLSIIDSSAHKINEYFN